MYVFFHVKNIQFVVIKQKTFITIILLSHIWDLFTYFTAWQKEKKI